MRFERFRCRVGEGPTLQYEFQWDARAIEDCVYHSIARRGIYIVRFADGAMFGPIREVGIVGVPPRDWGVLTEFHERDFSRIVDSGRLSPRAVKSLSAVLQPTDLICDFWPSTRTVTYRPLIRVGKPIMLNGHIPNAYWLGRTEEEAAAIYTFGTEWLTARVYAHGCEWVYGRVIAVHRDREFREVREFLAGAFQCSPDDVVLIDTPRFWRR